MKWHEIPVEKYFEGLVYSSEHPRDFTANYINVVPFIPTAEELPYLQESANDCAASAWVPMEKELSLSMNPANVVTRYLKTDVTFNFEKEYLEDAFTLINCPYKKGMTDEEKDSVRLGIMEDLASDYGYSRAIQSAKKWLTDRGIEIKIDEEQQDSGPEPDKIEWTFPKSAPLAFIMQKLAAEGFIQPPVRPNGEIHYKAFAEILSKAFSGLGSIDNLARALSPDNNKGLAENHQKRFRIPTKKEIS